MTFTDRGQGYDVAIGGLPFKLAVSGEQPYERATAQFRKEQFDSAPNVGDQSLTGWWTRGQLSFHKGAGVTYYEVLDGETVLDRFKDSENLEVFTPGQATLFPSLTDMSLTAMDAVPAPQSRGGGVYVLTDTGIEYTAGTSSTPIDTSDSEVPTTITSSGDLFYVTNGALIEQQFDSSDVRTNHLTNPSFETNTTGWSGDGDNLSQTNYVTNPSVETNTTGWSAVSARVRTNLCANPSLESNSTGWSGGGTVSPTVSRVTTRSAVGSASLQIAWGTGGTLPLASITIAGLTSGKQYTASAYGYVPSGDPSLQMVAASTFGTLMSTKGAWTRFSVTFTASSTSHALQIWPTSSPTSGDLAFIDGVLVEEGADLKPYFDGATTDGQGWVNAWTGTTNNSTSTATVDTSLVRTNLVPNPSWETNATTWGASGVFTYTRKPGVGGAAGTDYAQLLVSGSAATGQLTSDFIPILPERTYSAQSGFRRDSGNTATDIDAKIAFYWYDSSGTLISVDTTDVGDITSSWQVFSSTKVAPAGATQMLLALIVSRRAGTNFPAGDLFYVDAAMLEESETVGTYFDGATTDAGGVTYDWTGTTNLSTSTATSTISTSVTASSTRAKFGSKSLKVVQSHPILPVGCTYTVAGITSTNDYVYSAWVWLDAQDRSVVMKIGSAVVATITTTGSWQEITGTFTATATSQAVTFEHAGTGDAAAFYVDGFLWTDDPWTDGYFDGATADGSITYAWTGTVHASTSTATDTSTTVLTRSTDHAKYGTRSLKLSDEHTRGTPLTTQVTVSGLTPTDVYRLLAWVWVDAGGAQAVEMNVDGGAAIDTTTTEGAWEMLTGTFTASSATHDLTFTHSGAGLCANFYVDATLWTEDPYPGDYFDGSLSGASWAGTPHASKSTTLAGSDDATEALITVSGATWVKAWWAKGRIFAVDDDGYWYALPAAVDSVTNADAFWNSGKPDAHWSLTEGTGPVYISDGFDIYTVTVSTDGIVPVVATPTTAARMPLGEEIADMAYYLGYVVIATSRGVRVALTQDAQVLLGPLVIKGDFSKSNRIGAYDTRAYVVGRPDGRDGAVTLCAIDLSQFVTDLVPAWAPLTEVSDLASTASGAIVDASGRTYTWAAGTLMVTSLDSLATDGYLLTGFHRFGTLEPKHFQSVLVRLGGSAGTVLVTRVDADGTETDLETITLPSESVVVDLGLTTPQEMVGLKFTLTRSATDPTMGPELLGYQLRAMPAPKRQRMIRLPLMLKDVEQRGGAPSKGYKGSAWERLEALEAMEENGGTFEFVDYRTGEEGTVFVESVEHKGITAPGNTTPGFGGTLFVTLRKIEA